MSQQAPLFNTSLAEAIEPLIQTKLCIPQRRIHLVPRPRLINLLMGGLTRVLTLICAPAGYGKTTLLIDWITSWALKEDDCPSVAWLSLDEGDNDPMRFLSYLAATFAKANVEISDKVHSLLRALPSSQFETVLSFLINELIEQNKTFLLVLDDYQFIANPIIHEGLAFFLEHQPDNVHFVILTRSDPPIPLARLRSRGQLMELRANDLQFTFDETTQLLNQIMQLGLTGGDLGLLLDRTEGWAAGLQMAALALTGQPDRTLFVRNFSGSNRYILDFLVEEVLRHQSEVVQSFLIRTSILDSLSDSLCDAVILDQNVNRYGSSQEVLDYLERSNLFLISLDSERQWYRYHHLFADLLRARLERKCPQLVSQLHLRASEWYEQKQMISEAINHALAAKNYDLACRLIEIPIQQLIGKNNMLLLMGWIHQIPTDIASTHPWLCIAQAWSAQFTNEAARIEPFLQTAERNIYPETPPGLRDVWLGHIACLRAFVAEIQGDIKTTLHMANRALQSLPQEDPAIRTYAKYMLGRACFLRGDFSQATETLMENVRNCIESKGTNIIAPTLSVLWRICRIEGRLRNSIDVLKDGQTYIEGCDPQRVTVAGLAFIGQADVLRERNDLKAAEELAQRSVELCKPWVNPTSLCVCYSMLARIYLANGNVSAAEHAIQLAEESIRRRSPFWGAISDLNTARVEFWLTTGQLSKASQWAQLEKGAVDSLRPFNIPNEQDEITRVRVLIAERKIEPALQALEALALATQTGHRFGRLIEIRNLQALTLHAKGSLPQALILLKENLAMCEAENYIRIFVDEKEPMQELLKAYCLHTPLAPYRSYVQKLLVAFSRRPVAILSDVHPVDLVESLTSRELEVLQLLAEGCSNRQIAEALFLSEGTIKFHVHHILEKLQARTRSQAIAIARKQNLI